MYAATRAKKKGIVFDLKPEDIVIPDVCPVLGIKMERGGAQWNSPSLDRFDNSKGYTPDNVRVISSRANQIKSDATAEELLRVLAYVQETK